MLWTRRACESLSLQRRVRERLVAEHVLELSLLESLLVLVALVLPTKAKAAVDVGRVADQSPPGNSLRVRVVLLAAGVTFTLSDATCTALVTARVGPKVVT